MSLSSCSWSPPRGGRAARRASPSPPWRRRGRPPPRLALAPRRRRHAAPRGAAGEPPRRALTSSRLRGVWRSPARAVRAWLSAQQVLDVLDAELQAAIGALHHTAEALEVRLSDFGLRPLPKAEAFRLLRHLVNYDVAVVDAARLTHDVHLDYFMA